MSDSPSSSNPPGDQSIGWKPWGANTDRWWDGVQWTETYREIETK